MNILEAIKSGKKCKRRPWKKRWINPAQGKLLNLNIEDISANDWEVEEKSVTITRQQLDDAWLKSLSLKELAKELGL
jgi:hypothetical protein